MPRKKTQPKPRAPGTFKGVEAYSYGWAVNICADNQKHYVGMFRNQREAAMAFDVWSYALHGPASPANGMILDVERLPGYRPSVERLLNVA